MKIALCFLEKIQKRSSALGSSFEQNICQQGDWNEHKYREMYVW
jgi:hypothetical protein